VNQKPTVVLLHGLARTARSMARLERLITEAGYPTWSWTYPSRRQGIEALADAVAERLADDLGDTPVIGVTHSLGGIIVRHLAERANWQGVVMLAPPNGGSELARRLSGQSLFRWFFGPAGQDVGSPETWPSAPRPVAVIAGTGGASIKNPPSLLASALSLLPTTEAHDGTVSVNETRLPNMAGFATVDATHTWIMNHPEALALVLRFLDTGSFRELDPA
jgi:triacylglycerol lipase